MKVKPISVSEKETQKHSSVDIKNQSQYFDYELFILGEKEYNVYGMAVIQGQVYYYICDGNDYFPIAKPFHLFNIIDNRLSRYWIFGFYEGFEKYPVWVFPEWLNEPLFESYLTHYGESEGEIFKNYKELMDLEFPDKSVSLDAQIGDTDWLICPNCIDAWESPNDKDAMVRCPKCEKIMNNPRYVDTQVL